MPKAYMDQHCAVRVLKVGAIFLAAIVWFYAPLKPADARQQPDSQQGHLEIAGRGTTLDERVGADDGVSFVIHFSGDIHGNLDSCG